MENFDIYAIIMSFFQDALKGFSTGLMNAINSFVSIKIMLNAIGMFIIITYAIKKLQEGDFFTWKNAIGIILMVTYLSVFNLSINNPTTFMDFFYSLITYPAKTLTTEIAKQTAGLGEQSLSGMSSIGYTITKSLTTASQVVDRMLLSTGVGIPIIGDGLIIKGDIVSLILSFVIFVFTLVYVGLIFVIIVAAELQLLIWKSLALIIILLLLLPQTRGMAGAYVKFLIGLSFYKPFVLVMGFLVYSVLNYLLTHLPSKEQYLNMNMAQYFVEVHPLLYAGIFGILISVVMIKQVPTFINQIIGATSSIGGGLASLAQKAMAKTGGAVAGGAIGGVAGQAKGAYQGPGGGIGGLLAAGASTASAIGTGGLGNLATKGASKLATSGFAKAGAQKLQDTVGGKIGSTASKIANSSGNIGSGINNKLNQYKAGSAANNAVSKGVSAGANAARELGKKMSNKKK